MNILVTGANGFIGKNLCAVLANIRDGKDKTYGEIPGLNLFEYDLQTPANRLDEYCDKADFVFHLAGVNRPKEQSEFMEGNFGFTATLLACLKKNHNRCPVMISSSTQASQDNPYGLSKRAGEELALAYGRETGARVMVYRFPNIFGKWCRPGYNSAVATFCHNTAHGLPVQISDPNVVLNLVYIDDVVNELIFALLGTANETGGGFCSVPTVYTASLEQIVGVIKAFRDSRNDASVADMSDGFTQKLYATYLSYLPADGFSYPLLMHCDNRGSFTELFRTPERGQFSINTSKPGIVKGNHWHNTKNEKFVVVSGKGVIRLRKLGSDEVAEYYVNGEQLTAVDIPVGYTHNIENLGDNDMVTFMWASEPFNPDRPDTFFEVV